METKRDTFTDTRITVIYSSIDRCRLRRKFRTLKAARAFAHKMIGSHPDIGMVHRYAISGDGVGKITVEGISLAELFPPPARPIYPGDELTAAQRSDLYD